MKKTEHYKNHPNDIEPTIREKKMSRKLNALRDTSRLKAVNYSINNMLLKTQIRSDCNIKEMFEEMFPNEYKLAIAASGERHGFSKKKHIRKQEIIDNMKISNKYIIKRLK